MCASRGRMSLSDSRLLSPRGNQTEPFTLSFHFLLLRRRRNEMLLRCSTCCAPAPAGGALKEMGLGNFSTIGHSFIRESPFPLHVVVVFQSALNQCRV